MKNKISHKDPSSKQGHGIGIAAACLKAQLAVFLSALILLLIFSAIASSMEDPDSVLRPLALCALFLSTFSGGFYAVRRSGDGLLAGVCSGVVSAVLVFLLSLLPVYDSDAVLSGNLLMYLCMTASSAAGAVIGKRRGGNPRGKMRAVRGKR